MKKLVKTTVPLSIFTVLILISVITIYVSHQTPTEETRTDTLCTYTSIATYDYTAILEPNTIYNKTTLKPNEGILYSRMTKQINITFEYNFYANLLTANTITYNLTQTLKTPTWTYQASATAPTTTNQTRIQITILPVIKTELEAIKRQIETETGTSSTTYTFQISPTFAINANTTAGRIQEIFTPTLTMDFKRTDQGDIIVVENLYQTKTGAITENQTTTRQDIINQRYASYILATASIVGLFFSIYFYKKTKPTTQKSPLEKLIAPYKDLIIEAQEQSKTPSETTTINVTTIQELVKTAEILARPIIHEKEGNTHTFYIMDNNTKYQHKTTDLIKT